MARDLLIDGYNLMHAVGLARRRYGPGDLERCRDRLLKWLSRNLRDSERLRTTVVFDAKDAPVAGNLDLHFRDMTIRFAGKEAEADDLIEALIEYHSAPKRLIVVSGDRRLQRRPAGDGDRHRQRAVSCRADAAGRRHRSGTAPAGSETGCRDLGQRNGGLAGDIRGRPSRRNPAGSRSGAAQNEADDLLSAARTTAGGQQFHAGKIPRETGRAETGQSGAGTFTRKAIGPGPAQRQCRGGP